MLFADVTSKTLYKEHEKFICDLYLKFIHEYEILTISNNLSDLIWCVYHISHSKEFHFFLDLLLVPISI